MKKIDVLMHVWRSKRDDSIHIAGSVNPPLPKEGNWLRFKEASQFTEYNKFVKYVDWADQDLSYHSILWKTLKWSKKVILHLVFVEN
jgi:hypothetical protein